MEPVLLAVGGVLVVRQVDHVHPSAFVGPGRPAGRVVLVICCRRLRYDSDLVVDPQRSASAGYRRRRTATAAAAAAAALLDFDLLLVQDLPGHHRMGRVDVILEQFVHGEGGRADGALVRQMGRFQTQSVVFDDVAQQFPLMDLSIPK